jgi:hypothetical protein
MNYYHVYLQFNGREKLVFWTDVYGECEAFLLRFHKHALRLHSTGLNPRSWKHDIAFTATYEQ